MKTTLKLATLILLAFVFNATAAVVTFNLTNSVSVADTNTFWLYPVSTPILNDGGWATTGSRITVPNPTGSVTLTNLMPGNYLASNQWLKAQSVNSRGVLFAVPNDVTATEYFALAPPPVGLAISGGNVYNYTPGQLLVIQTLATNYFISQLNYASNFLWALSYTLSANGTNYANTRAANNTNFSLSIGLAATNYSNAKATAGTNYTLSVGQNATNHALALGANSTNYTLAVGLNATNYALSIGANDTNHINTKAANGTNYANTVGLNATNFALSLGLNGTNYALSLGVNETNFANTKQFGSANLTNWSAVTVASMESVAAHSYDTNWVTTNAFSAMTNWVHNATNGLGGGTGSGDVTAAQLLAATNTVFHDAATVATNLATANTNFTLSVGANDTNYTKSVGLNGTNFTLLVGLNNTNYTLIVGQNSTNYTLAVGANVTNHANAKALDGTNYTLSVGVNVTNLINTKATAATNYTLQVGADVTNYANTKATAATNYTLSVGANATNFTLAVGVNMTNHANAKALDGTNFSLSIGANDTNYVNTKATASTNYTLQVGANATNYANAAGLNGTNYTLSVGANATNFGNATFVPLAGYVPNMTNANILWVSTNGNDATAIVGVFERPWKTIATALAAATAGKTVMLMPGVYTNGIGETISSALVIPIGVVLAGFGPDSSVIDGSMFGYTVFVDLNDNSVCENLSIYGGSVSVLPSSIGGLPTTTNAYVRNVRVRPTFAIITPVWIVFDGSTGGPTAAGTNKVEITFEHCSFAGNSSCLGYGYTAAATSSFITNSILKFVDCQFYAETGIALSPNGSLTGNLPYTTWNNCLFDMKGGLYLYSEGTDERMTFIGCHFKMDSRPTGTGVRSDYTLATENGALASTPGFSHYYNCTEEYWITASNRYIANWINQGNSYFFENGVFGNGTGLNFQSLSLGTNVPLTLTTNVCVIAGGGTAGTAGTYVWTAGGYTNAEGNGFGIYFNNPSWNITNNTGTSLYTSVNIFTNTWVIAGGASTAPTSYQGWYLNTTGEVINGYLRSTNLDARFAANVAASWYDLTNYTTTNTLVVASNTYKTELTSTIAQYVPRVGGAAFDAAGGTNVVIRYPNGTNAAAAVAGAFVLYDPLGINRLSFLANTTTMQDSNGVAVLILSTNGISGKLSSTGATNASGYNLLFNEGGLTNGLTRGTMMISNSTATFATTTTPATLTNWTYGVNARRCAIDAANGTMTLTNTGIYMVTCNFSVDTQAGAGTCLGEIYIGATATGLRGHTDSEATAGHAAAALNGLIEVVNANTVLTLKLSSTAPETQQVQSAQLTVIQQIQ